MIKFSKLREAEIQDDQNNNCKCMQEYSSRKRRFSVIGRYGFRAMSPILEKDEDIHYTNKKRHIIEAKVKKEETSATKSKHTKKRFTSHVQVPVNLKKSIEIKFLNPADGKIDSRKRNPENQKARKIKWQKKLRRRSSGQQKTNIVSAEVSQMLLSSEEVLTTEKINTISISFSRKKEKRNVNSSICARRNNLDTGISNYRKNKNSLVAKHNITSYSKKSKNNLVTNDKKSLSSTLKQCKKSVNKSNCKSDSDKAVAQRFQMQQLRKKLSSPPKLNKIKSSSTRKSQPRTNKFKNKAHRKTSNDGDDKHQKKETNLLDAKNLLPKTGNVSSTVPADVQNHCEAHKDEYLKKVEPECSLPTSKHIQIMKSDITNNLGLTFPQETCIQNLMSSETFLKQTNFKKSVFSLGSTTHSLNNLCNGEPHTKAKYKINLASVSPKHSDKAFNENLFMESSDEIEEEDSNLFNMKLNRNQLIPGTIVFTEENILNDIITTKSLFRNNISSDGNHKLFPPKTSVVKSDQTKQNSQYNNMAYQRSTVKVSKQIHLKDNSKPAMNTNTSTSLIDAKCASSCPPYKRGKMIVKNNCLTTAKYSHNLNKNNNFPNTSNAAWILPKSFPCDWLNTQDDIQLERKKSMMSCNIEVVPNSNDYEWRTWF